MRLWKVSRRPRPSNSHENRDEARQREWRNKKVEEIAQDVVQSTGTVFFVAQNRYGHFYAASNRYEGSAKAVALEEQTHKISPHVAYEILRWSVRIPVWQGYGHNERTVHVDGAIMFTHQEIETLQEIVHEALEFQGGDEIPERWKEVIEIVARANLVDTRLPELGVESNYQIWEDE